jgi:hypothetical protein
MQEAIAAIANAKVVSQSLKQLRIICEDSGLDFLGYLISVAESEADRVLMQRQAAMTDH